MPRTLPPVPVQGTAPIRPVRDPKPSPPAKPLDVLVISLGTPNLATCERACEDCQLTMDHMPLGQQSGATMREKVAALFQLLREKAAKGEIDQATQVVVDMHGVIHGDKLVMGDGGSVSSLDQVIEDAAAFLIELRGALAASADAPWEGLMLVEACHSGLLREALKDQPGYALLFAGHNTVFDDDAYATLDSALRTMSAAANSRVAPSRKHLDSVLQSARKRTGENIALVGSGEVLAHKAIDFEVALRPESENLPMLLSAKLDHGSAKTVKQILQAHPERVLERDPKGAYAFMRTAIETKREGPEKIKLLLKAGHPVNGHCSVGESPIVIAAEEGNREAVRLLLRHGANPWERTAQGQFAWQFARGDVLDLLMDHANAMANSKLNAMTPPDDTRFPLHAACAKGELEATKSVRPSHLRAKDAQGNTPLGVALLHGQTAMIEALLRRYADVEVSLHTGDTLLAHAVLYGQTEAARMLLAAHASSILAERDTMPLLARAMHAIHAGLAGMDLLDLVLGTEAGTQGLGFDLPVHYALRLGNMDLALRLVAAGADPHIADETGRCAFDVIDEDWNDADQLKAELEAAIV